MSSGLIRHAALCYHNTKWRLNREDLDFKHHRRESLKAGITEIFSLFCYFLHAMQLEAKLFRYKDVNI
jgi:hypothetical protein